MSSGTDRQSMRRLIHGFADSAPGRRSRTLAKIAMAVLLALITIWGASARIAQAEETEEPVFDLNIPAMQAELAIKALARQTGYSVLYESATVANIRTKAVDGQYTVPVALRALLRDTQLDGQLSQRGVITISYKPENGTKQMVAANEKSDKSFWGGLAAAIASALTLNTAGADNGIGVPQGGTLEEVIVTAQKREQSLQDTPIAITAMDVGELEQRGIKDITDIGTSAPNVMINPSPSNTTRSTIAIRGSATTNPAITWEPTVGLYLDGIYMGKSAGSIFKVAELERVEVLRGPQGTLYGKNTIAGAVNLITRKPTGEFGGLVRANYGNYDYYELYASMDLPQLELGGLGSLKPKVTLSKDKRDGFYDVVAATKGPITNPFTGALVEPNPPSREDAFNAMDNEAGRLDLLWDLNDSLSLRYTFDRVEVENTPTKPQLTYLDLSSLGLGVPFPGDLQKYVLSSNDNARKVSTDAEIYDFFRSTGHSLFVTYDLPDMGALGEMTLKYIGNTRDLDFGQGLDLDGTAFSFFHVVNDGEYEQESHELQLTGSTERTDYVLGLYYFEEEADVLKPRWPLNFFLGPFMQVNRDGFSGEQEAVYGQFEWRPAAAAFEDRLTLTFGLRWTKEEKDAWVQQLSAKDNDSWTSWTPTVIAGYDLTDDVRVYAKYAEGFKAGGFNGQATTVDSFRGGYGPEEVKSYEMGVKTRLLDNTLQLNAAVFYDDQTDLQLSVFTSGRDAASSVRNAGKATKKGAELEVIYSPIIDLQLTANLGYLDVEYGEFEEFDPVLGQVVDKSDERDIQYSPEYTVNAGVEYVLARGGWGEVIARLDYSYVDDYVPYTNPDQNVPLQIDSRGLLNGRLTLANVSVGSDSVLRVALWGKNMTDEDYRISGIPFGPIATSTFGDPRTYGIEVALDF